MPDSDRASDLIVVGGGQAGLAASYWAKRGGLSHRVFDDAERTGDAWRNRYDSLRLFTPRSHSQLPGLALPGDPSGLPSKDEIADYLERYASEHRLPVIHSAPVTGVTQGRDRFDVSVGGQTFSASAVVVATGSFQRPFVPA